MIGIPKSAYITESKSAVQLNPSMPGLDGNESSMNRQNDSADKVKISFEMVQEGKGLELIKDAVKQNVEANMAEEIKDDSV